MAPLALTNGAARAKRLFGHFGLRLAVGLALALGAAEGITYLTLSDQLEREQIKTAASLHHSDVNSLARAVAPYPARERWLREAADQLTMYGSRAGVLESILVDSRFRVVAARDQRAVGRLDRSNRLADALRTGRAWVGHEADKRRDQRDFEFIQPLTIHGHPYVLEITTAGEAFDSQLATIRAHLLLAGILSILAATGLFWLTGGRRVLRMHRFALERATLDGLTELPNHRAFHDAMRNAADGASRYGESVALLLLDLDGFKAENDRHGHRHGDDRLRATAGALSGGRPSDLPFRIGGDEFAMLLPHADAAGARRAATRLHRRLAEARVSASVGVGVLRRGQSPHDLREEVDAALYEAKRSGGDCTVLFDDISAEVSVLTDDRREAFNELLAARAIDMAFQPIRSLPVGDLIAVEALARPHAEYAFAGPAEMFDTAQQVGQVEDLDRLCVDRILARVPELPDGVLLFINLAPQTLELGEGSVRWFAQAVADAGLLPSRVVVEVTERMGARTNQVLRSVADLKARGFAVAIDDVGSGNAGLEMLRKTRAEYIKLDRSVVVGALTDPHARGVLMAITAFAHETGAFVIAEGIEDDDVLEFITTLGTRTGIPHVDGGQGYGLGRPQAELPEAPQRTATSGSRAPHHADRLA